MKKKEDWKVLLTLVLSMGILAGVTLCVMGGSLQKKSPQPVYVEDERVPLSNGEVRLISQTKADRAVVPDKYNCGVQGSLTTVTAGETVNGVKFKEIRIFPVQSSLKIWIFPEMTWAFTMRIR